MEKFSLNASEFKVLSQQALSRIKGGYGYYDGNDSGGGPGTPNITIGPISGTGVTGDVSISPGLGGWVPEEGVGVHGNWRATGHYGVGISEDGEWSAGLSLSLRTPEAFNNPFWNGHAEVSINGTDHGYFTLKDFRELYEETIYETGTIPICGSLDLPNDFQGGLVTITVTMGVYDGDFLGATGSYEVITLEVWIPPVTDTYTTN